MERFEKIYRRVIVPVWLVLLTFNAVMWSLNAYADRDAGMVWALVLLWIYVPLGIVTEILMVKGRRAGEIMNILALVFSMLMTGAILGMKAYALFFVDMERALASGVMAVISVLVHTGLLLYFIHYRREKDMAWKA